MNVRISAVVCTFNRAEYLRKALGSLVDQTLEKTDYEIVVVDNASTDETQRVLTEEFGSVSNLRSFRETLPGVSRARNAGWKNARARYVAYLDDDAIASPDWLQRMLEVFETTRPTPGAVGGKIEPIWEAPKPVWLSDRIARSLTIVDWSPDPVVLGQDQWIAAANIAFPRRILADVGGFSNDLGRRGARLLSNEENLVRLQIEDSGLVCYYHPEIVVRHHVHAGRLSQQWFTKRYWWQGVSDARMALCRAPMGGLARAVMGVRTMMLSPGQLASIVLRTKAPDRFEVKCRAWQRVGRALTLMGIIGR